MNSKYLWMLLISFYFGANFSLGDEPAKEKGWLSSRGDLAQRGIATCDLPKKLSLLWEVKLGDQILGTAAIRGDRCYVPCLSGELFCLDRATGKTIWTYRSVEEVAANSFRPGFKSSPTVVGNCVYLGDEDGVMHAVDLQKGTSLWTFKSEGEIYSAAAIFEGKLVFGSYDNYLYCLKVDDGALVWKYETQGYVHCSPAIALKSTFIAGCDEHLRVIDIDTGKQRLDLSLSTYLIASPAVIDDTLYVGTFSAEVLAVNWKEAKVNWRYAREGSDMPFHSSAAVTDRYVLLGGRDKRVHCIHRDTGKPNWTYVTKAKVDSSPVVVKDRVYIGSGDGFLYGLNIDSGEVEWKYNIGKPISAGPAIGEEVLVIGSESRDGRVYCFGKKP